MTLKFPAQVREVLTAVLWSSTQTLSRIWPLRSWLIPFSIASNIRIRSLQMHLTWCEGHCVAPGRCLVVGTVGSRSLFDIYLLSALTFTMLVYARSIRVCWLFLSSRIFLGLSHSAFDGPTRVRKQERRQLPRSRWHLPKGDASGLHSNKVCPRRDTRTVLGWVCEDTNLLPCQMLWNPS